MSISLKELAILGLIALAAAAGSSALLKYFPPVSQLENLVSDIRVATSTKNQDQHEDIVIVTITEDTLALFPYRSPINRLFLANLIQALEAKGAKAIGVDVLFDTPTEDDADTFLQQTLRTVGIPVVMSYADNEMLVERQQQYIDAYLDGLGKGFANVVTNEQDDVVRDVFAGKIWTAQDGTERFIPDLGGALAEAVGVSPPQDRRPLVYRGYPEGQSPMNAFKRYPAHTVPLLPDAWFQDKIVLIGAELTEIDIDIKKTPFAVLPALEGGSVPGVMIHAHVLAQVLDGTTFPAVGFVGSVVIIVIVALLGAVFARIDMNIGLRLVLAVILIVGLWSAGFTLYANGLAMIPLVAPSIAFMGAAFVGLLFVGRQDREQKRFIKDAFSRYLSPALVDQLVADPSKLNLQGERRELTFIFTDVAGFTSISEALPPTTLVHVLNEYMEGMTDIVIKHGGTIDKFIGDAVMAVFGAPMPMDDHAGRAVACALELDAFASRFKDEATDEHGDPCPFGITRIGVHTGEATIGNFGSTQRFDYTALGDTVNSAARLESLNKQFGTVVCISTETIQRAPDFSDRVRPMASVVVKGKTEALDIFTVVRSEEMGSEMIELYREAYARMEQQNETAAELFEKLSKAFPADPLIALHARRLAEGAMGARMELKDK